VALTLPEPRTGLVTGATSGLGEALAIALARRNWVVLAHGRDPERGTRLIERLKSEGAAGARFYGADFGSLHQVDKMARQLLLGEQRLDLLVNNAAVGILRARALSDDGYDLVMQVNHLAPFQLSRELRPLLARTGGAAIVNIVSAGQWKLDFEDLMMAGRWSGAIAYGRSKLALVMTTVETAPELARVGIRADAVHPATLMPTKMTAQLAGLKPRNLIGALLHRRLKPRSTLEEGVANVLRLVDDPSAPDGRGRYFHGSREKRPLAQARDPAALARLAALSHDLCCRALSSC
jgi:NAD(P)-dependent dehydrogenase (short-subunit alcohol dehydrogenase family)